jgi:two-component system response regulator CpxR
LTGNYGVIVVDALLPVLDGFGLIHELRTRSSVPVLLIGSTEEQCLAGREAGADDFILKPFGAGEFLARVRVLQRRNEKMGSAPETVVECDGLTVNVKNHQAWLGDELLVLTNVEFAILKCLTRNVGRVVSRDELAAVLYQRKSTPFERSIDVHISHLRKKIERAGGISIRTIRGVGYLLACLTR